MTKRTQPKHAAQSPADYAELAAHIATVLAHPLTPVDVYNDLVGRLCDLETHDYTNAAEVERILAGHAEETEELYGKQ